MEKVLIIANEFPPMGGAGVQRTTKFVKYLGDFDFEPVVVTKEHVADLSDWSLLEDIPDNVEIKRLKPYDTVNRKGILRLPMKFLGTRIMSPDSEYFWYLLNRDKVLDMVKEEGIKLVYSTSFPYSSHLLGLYLRRNLTDIKWVADFRDEWTNNPYHRDSIYKRIKFKGEKRMELQVTEGCDYFITNTPLMLENFVADNSSLLGRSTFIPNGYDEEDFQGLKNERDGGNKFVVTYTGSLYGRRNLDEFMDGLKLAIQKGEIERKDLEIRIVGNIYDSVIDAYAAKYDLEGQIKSYGYLPHKESIQMLFNSDIILLVIGKGKGSRNFYTGKIFEYIRSDRPVLAIVPEDGVAAQVIRETKTGTVVDPEDISGVAETLVEYYSQWKQGNIEHSPDWDNVRKYSRKSQTGKLAEIFLEQLQEKR
ncbi:glycosyltransferase family 4 protein [Gudongella sp. SC589]|jgi:glycosyltransferase involved in cell wall biosynthesis|uniref:glycosyltransferase family 4 protein n=1 Tax=Gudongella sp. SC589 TaxID=3385990 RepID=UPI003904D0CA